MSDLGLLSYYLGLEVKQQSGDISICQGAYAKKILDISGMKGCNPMDTPMEQHIKLLPGKLELVTNATNRDILHRITEISCLKRWITSFLKFLLHNSLKNLPSSATAS